METLIIKTFVAELKHRRFFERLIKFLSFVKYRPKNIMGAEILFAHAVVPYRIYFPRITNVQKDRHALTCRLREQILFRLKLRRAQAACP